MKDYRLYILLRNDLPSMGAGRASAQASHASNAFIHKYGKKEEVVKWQRQTSQGFGTAIVLSVNKHQMDVIFENLKRHKVKDRVVDPDYCITVNQEVADLLRQNYDAAFCNFMFRFVPGDDKTVVITRKEVTCAYVFGDKEELEPELGALPLYS